MRKWQYIVLVLDSIGQAIQPDKKIADKELQRLGKHGPSRMLKRQEAIPESFRGKYLCFWLGINNAVYFIFWDTREERWVMHPKEIWNFWFKNPPKLVRKTR